MKYIDKCNIKLIGGKGGDGFVDFIQWRRGDHSGGNGGRGGNIYFLASEETNTLLNISGQGIYQAGSGEKGKAQRGGGSNGEDLFLEVPFGTEVYDGDRLITTIKSEKPTLIVRGGKGGRGNALLGGKMNGSAERIHWAEEGKTGEELQVTLVLTVLSDVGFVGKPSAGKSTLLSVISDAKPKIAAYHFTTLKPQLGLVKASRKESYVVADLPGLIKGASQGKGLGIEFLNHIKKCKAIAHILDFGDEQKDPIVDFKEINKELELFDPNLLRLPTIIVANKMDCDGFSERLEKFKKEYPDLPAIPISALMNKNIRALKKIISEKIKPSI